MLFTINSSTNSYNSHIFSTFTNPQVNKTNNIDTNIHNLFEDLKDGLEATAKATADAEAAAKAKADKDFIFGSNNIDESAKFFTLGDLVCGATKRSPNISNVTLKNLSTLSIDTVQKFQKHLIDIKNGTIGTNLFILTTLGAFAEDKNDGS